MPVARVSLRFEGRTIHGESAADLVATLRVREFGYAGPREALGPFAAWLADQCGASPVDPSLPDEEAAAALIAGLLACGAAEPAPLARVIPLRGA